MPDTAALTFAFMRSHPVEAARVLDGATSSASVDLLSGVPVRIGGAVLAEMFASSAAQVLLEMREERALELLTHLPAQRAVAILRHMDAGTRTRLLSGLPTATSLVAKLLLEYIDDAVGSCMNPDVIAFAGDVPVDESLDRVRKARGPINHVFVIDGSRHLLGWVPLANLMRAPGGARLETLMLPVPARLAAHAPLSGARIHPGWQTASILPVVDRHGHLLGEIARDALERASHAVQPVKHADGSLASAMVEGYWQSISGILELLISMLPASRPIGPARRER